LTLRRNKHAEALPVELGYNYYNGFRELIARGRPVGELQSFGKPLIIHSVICLKITN